MANISLNSILSYAKITIGADTFVFQTSSIYKVAAIASATGITYIGPDSYDGLEPLVKVEQLIRSGKLVRLNALCANPIEGRRNKNIEVLCATDLSVPARAALVGKTLQVTKNGITRALGKVIRVRAKARDRFI
jgi:hypothetical protein